MRSQISVGAWTLAAIVTAAAGARAEGRNPGSLLLFPEFDHSAGHDTLVTVTNTNLDAETGEVRLHYRYVSGVEPTHCLEGDRFENLTAGDTISVLTSAHGNAPASRGFLYVFAVDAANRAVSFDHLVGDVLQLDGALALEHAINAVPFEAVKPQGSLTDMDGDGLLDLDGVEYEEAPDRIQIPRFLGQTATIQSDVVFVGLTGGRQFDTLIDLLYYNDNEEIFSAQFSFRCWAKVPLLEVNAGFANDYLHDVTNDSPVEIFGLPGQESGWILLDGAFASSTTTSYLDPAFVAVLSERSGVGARHGAELPYFDGKQPNGALLPVTPAGDPD